MKNNIVTTSAAHFIILQLELIKYLIIYEIWTASRYSSVVGEHSIQRWVHGLIFVVVFLRKTLYAPDHAWRFIALGCSSLHYMGLAWSVISVDYFPSSTIIYLPPAFSK